MGIFDRFKGGRSKDEDAQNNSNNEEEVDVQEETEEEQPKKKRGGLFGLFNRNKKETGIIESMGLNEAVASMGLSVLDDIVQSNEDSAVRELDEGYTVVALTEEMLQDMDVDTKSADFGSFANAIASEHIESLLLENDLHNGVLVIIPDRDTLDILDEFSFLEDTAYRWAVIPIDIDDDSTAVLLDNGATLGDLNIIADDDIQLVLQDGQILTEEQAEQFSQDEPEEDYDNDDDIASFDDDSDLDDDFDADEDVFSDIFDDDEDDVDSFNDDFDTGFDDDGFDDFSDEPADSGIIEVDVESDDDDDIDAYDEAVRYEELYGDPNAEFKDRALEMEDDDDDFDFDLDDDLDDDFDDDDYMDDDLDDLIDDDDSDSIELQSPEEGREMIEGVLDREFHNDELGLSLKGDAFNQQFSDVHVIKFDEELLDDSSLSHTVSEMRRDANTRLASLHNSNLQKLRSHYQNGLSDIHDKLVDMLDYEDSETAFGERYDEILSDRETQEERADELVARGRDELDKEYDEKRDAFADRARREALSKFDDQNKEQHELEKRRMGDEVDTNIALEFDSELSDLYEERQNVATRIFDKMTTRLLIEIQKLHEENMAHEQELYEEFHTEIDAYVRENYTDEVLRAKALATQQRQHHEADEVRSEYEQMLASKQRQLEEAESKADAELRKLENSHSKAIQETVSEYKRQVSKREDEIQELRKDTSKLQDRIVAIGREKDEEYSQRLRTNEDTIESQRKQIEYEQERADKQGRQSSLMLMGMVVVGVALGLIGGFLIGAQREEPMQQAPGAGNQMGAINLVLDDEGVESTDVLSYDDALTNTFNALFAHDDTLVR